jgi:hypothetical protein
VWPRFIEALLLSIIAKLIGHSVVLAIDVLDPKAVELLAQRLGPPVQPLQPLRLDLIKPPKLLCYQVRVTPHTACTQTTVMDKIQPVPRAKSSRYTYVTEVTPSFSASWSPMTSPVYSATSFVS